MKTLIASAAIALAFAAPAVADNSPLVEFAQEIANASTDGQDFRVGTDAGPVNYDLVAFAQSLANASSDGADFRVGSASDVTASTRGISAGHAKLAESLGVSAADYSLTELAQIKANENTDGADFRIIK